MTTADTPIFDPVTDWGLSGTLAECPEVADVAVGPADEVYVFARGKKGIDHVATNVARAACDENGHDLPRTSEAVVSCF